MHFHQILSLHTMAKIAVEAFTEDTRFFDIVMRMTTIFMTLVVKQYLLCHVENPFHNGLMRETVTPLDGANKGQRVTLHVISPILPLFVRDKLKAEQQSCRSVGFDTFVDLRLARFGDEIQKYRNNL